MEWKKEKLQSIWKLNKERIIFLFSAGLLLFLISIPNDGGMGAASPASSGEVKTQSQSGAQALQDSSGDGVREQTARYESELEDRIREILSQVDGVGQVDVMVVLKATGEQVYHTDKTTSSSRTEEGTGAVQGTAGDGMETGLEAGSGIGTGVASGGGMETGSGRAGDGTIDVWSPIGTSGRVTIQQDIKENTILDGASSVPVVEKELMPEISGIVISAEGGGSALVKTEISQAMEALFGLPSHKIKILKKAVRPM